MTTQIATTPTSLEQLTFFTPEEVAKKTGFSKAQLAQLRYTGEGPAYFKLSARVVRYLDSDVTAWILSKKRTCTVDL